MTYRAPDGHQYVAIMTGVGGAAMVTQGHKGFPARGSTMYVFALGANVPSLPAGKASDSLTSTSGAKGSP